MRHLLKCAALALAIATGGAVAAHAADYRLGLITPPPHQWTKTAEAAAAEIKQKTDGRVNILIFPSGQLGNEAQMLQQLQTGALDFAFMTLGEFSNRDPNYGIFLAPYLVRTEAEARPLLKGPTAKKLLKGMNKFGLVGLGWSMAGLRMIVMHDDVTKVDQLRGKKVRVIPYAPSISFWKHLGAAPTPMPLPAIYDAFANGQIDGMQIDVEGTWNSKYYDHAGSILLSNHMMFPMAAVASGRKWKGMSAADRKVVEDVFADKLDAQTGMYADIDRKYEADLKTTKVPVRSVDRAWFGPGIDAWYKEWEVKAPMLKALVAEAKGS